MAGEDEALYQKIKDQPVVVRGYRVRSRTLKHHQLTGLPGDDRDRLDG